jgi:hypothetical protein
MKPLPVAALTDEDFWIWANHVTCRNVSPLGLFGRSQDADRRDAALMLVAVRHPILAALGNPEFPGYRIDIRQGTGHSVAHLKMHVTRDRGIT